MSDYHLQKKRAKDRRRYRKARAKGLCGYCKKKPAAEGKSYCQACYDARRDQMRAYLKKRRALWKALKVCVRCGARGAMIGRVVCGVCSESNSEMATKRRREKSLASA